MDKMSKSYSFLFSIINTENGVWHIVSIHMLVIINNKVDVYVYPNPTVEANKVIKLGL